MDLITVGALAAAAWAFLSGDSDEDEDKDQGGDGDGDGDGNGNRWQPPGPGPGPVPDRDDIDVEDFEQAVKVAELIKDPPEPESFYQIYKGGPSAVFIAGQMLGQLGLNTGSNRARLIRCWTRLRWNSERYASTMTTESFPAYLEVDGQNLAAAWFPRNAPAAALLAQKVRPPREINPNGSWMGNGTSYGLVWLGDIEEVDGSFVCDPDSEPPAWLLESIEDT